MGCLISKWVWAGLAYTPDLERGEGLQQFFLSSPTQYTLINNTLSICFLA